MEVTHWCDYKDVPLYLVDGTSTYTFKTTHVALDADGSPRAYHPDDKGLDYLLNAGYPHRGWRSVLVVDPTDPDVPYVQATGPCAGYFLCKTSLQDNKCKETDPARYVNAEEIPYIVAPGAFYAITGTGVLGDFVAVRKLGSNKESGAIIADGGPFNAPLGEMSLRLAIELGGTHPNPRNGHGAPSGTLQYVVFPRSHNAPPWPLTREQIQARTTALLTQIGGWPKLP